jgi:hypothetical protein
VKEPAGSQPGNAGTFLFRLEGILEGLIEDMITVDTPEAIVRIYYVSPHPLLHPYIPPQSAYIEWNITDILQEKTRKVLEIWTKGKTFPADVLSRLLESVNKGGQGAYPFTIFVFAFCANHCAMSQFHSLSIPTAFERSIYLSGIVAN